MTNNDITSHYVTQQAPAGRYNIYVTPQIPLETEEDIEKYKNCKIAPMALTGRELLQNGMTIVLDVGQADRLEGTLTGANLQGWQLVDELNRAIQGEACSGYITSPALVTPAGLEKMGDSNAFDPDIPYRDAYATIWGK